MTTKMFWLAAAAILGGSMASIAVAAPHRAMAALPGTWVSDQEHYFGAASCHPNCQPGQGDHKLFKEKIPAYVNPDTLRYTCHGNGHTGDPCAFDSLTYTVDPKNGVWNVDWFNRSDEVWVRLTATEKPIPLHSSSRR